MGIGKIPNDKKWQFDNFESNEICESRYSEWQPKRALRLERAFFAVYPKCCMRPATSALGKPKRSAEFRRQGTVWADFTELKFTELKIPTSRKRTLAASRKIGKEGSNRTFAAEITNGRFGILVRKCIIFATFAKPNKNNAIVSCVNQVQDSDLATKGIAALVYATAIDHRRSSTCATSRVRP